MSNFFTTIPALQFNPSTLTADFEPVSMDGFDESIKVMHFYNGYTSSIDISFDGTNLAFVLPSGGVMIVDLQTNHACVPPSGGGTLNGKKGQNVWVRTSENPTYLTIGGYL